MNIKHKTTRDSPDIQYCKKRKYYNSIGEYMITGEFKYIYYCIDGDDDDTWTDDTSVIEIEADQFL